VQAAVARERSGFSLSSSPGYIAATTHNLIFLNQRDEAIHQLLPTNDQVFVYREGFPKQREDDQNEPPVAKTGRPSRPLTLVARATPRY
jgi:hypothetical protein